MIDWKPIDTMPDEMKDGRNVLLWSGFLTEACWSQSRWAPNGEQVPGWVDDGGAIMCEVSHFSEINEPEEDRDAYHF